MQFIFGPLLFVAGLAMMKYTVQVTNFTGQIDWAEKYLGGGNFAGTYTWWRIVGLCMCIGGGLWFFGLWNLVGNGLVSVLPGTH